MTSPASHATQYAERKTAPLRVHRVARGLRQSDLAALAGLRPETVGRLETGRHRPTLATAQALALALGVEPGDLWPSDDDAPAGNGRAEGVRDADAQLAD